MPLKGCKVVVVGLTEASLQIEIEDGVKAHLYYTDRQLPVLNRNFYYDMELKEFSEGRYSLVTVHGMYPREEIMDKTQEFIEAIDENDLQGSFDFLKREFELSEEDLYYLFYEYRLKLLLLLSDDYNYLSRAPTEMICRLCDTFVNKDQDLLDDLEDVGPEYFRYFKLRHSMFPYQTFPIETAKRLKLLNEAAMRGKLLPEGVSKLSNSLYSKFKRYNFGVLHIGKPIPSLDGYEKVAPGVFFSKPEKCVILINTGRIPYEAILRVKTRAVVKVVGYDVFDMEDCLQVPFSLKELFETKEYGSLEPSKAKGDVDSLEQLLKQLNFIVVTKTRNYYLERFFVAEVGVCKGFATREEPWDGIIRTDQELFALHGCIIRCIKDSMGDARGSFYKVYVALGKKELHPLDGSAKIKLLSVNTITKKYAYIPFVTLQDYSIELFQKQLNIIHSSIPDSVFRFAPIQTKKLKLYR